MIEDAATHLLSAEANPSLPPLPEDELGRYVRWMLITDTEGGGFWCWSRVSQEYVWVEVSEGEIDRWVSEYGRMCAGGYEAPLQAEHSGMVTGGERLGDILALAKWWHPERGEWALIGAVAFAAVDADVRIQRRSIRFCSPGFGSFTDERGQEFEFVFLELSLTTRPQQKNKGVTHVLSAATGGSDVEEEKTTTEAPDVGARLSALEEGMTALTGAVQALTEQVNTMSQGEEPKAEAMAEEPEESASAQLSAEVQQLRLELGRERFVSGLPGELTLSLSADAARSLFDLANGNAEAIEGFLTLAKPTKAKVEKAASASPDLPSASGVRWDVVLGAEVGEPETEKPSKDQLREQARALQASSGGKYMDHYRALCAQNGYEV